MPKRYSIKRKEKDNSSKEVIKKPASDQYHLVGCIVCGKDLIYAEQAISRPCSICGQIFETRVYCEDGHFVCDVCHSASKSDVKWFLRHTFEKDPIKILLHVFEMEKVHMHGPEHHSIVPGVLVTAYRNNGGEIDYEKALELAFERGSQVPGGYCGYWGACGAAVGVGIYACIVLDGSPLKKETWNYPQQVTARCLDAMTAIGGPRCCKRVSRLAIEVAVEWTKEYLGVTMPMSYPKCTFFKRNRECIHNDCPFFGRPDGLEQEA